MPSHQRLDLLVCAATVMELRAFGTPLGEDAAKARFIRRGSRAFLVTGPGVPAVPAHTLEAAGRERPARILNIGIAGAFALCREHPQDMDPDVIRGHIALYVNGFTGDIGAEGRAAVDFFFACQRELAAVEVTH